MLNGDGNKNGKKSIGLISKKNNNFACAAHLFGQFLCRSFAPLIKFSCFIFQRNSPLLFLSLTLAGISIKIEVASRFE